MGFQINSRHKSFERIYEMRCAIAAILNAHMFPFDEFYEWSEEERLETIWRLENAIIREIQGSAN